MVTEEQFVDIIWKCIDPARSIQSDMKKRMLDFIFWWRVVKNGLPTTTISFHEAWDQQVRVEAALAEEDKLAAQQTAYRAMGVVWEAGKSPPVSCVAKERFDAEGNTISSGDASSTADSPVRSANSPLLSPSAIKLYSSPVHNRGRIQVHPKGRTLILATLRRERKKLEASTRQHATSHGGHSVTTIESSASPSKKVHCEVIEMVRPENMAINTMRIPHTLGAHSFGRDGFAGSKATVANFEKSTYVSCCFLCASHLTELFLINYQRFVPSLAQITSDHWQRYRDVDAATGRVVL